jgi:hypothetical protein
MSDQKSSAPAAVKAPEVKKPAKVEIDPKTLKLPADVVMKVCKTCVIFTKGNKKAALKGHLLELTNPTKEMGDRVQIFTATEIEKCHLGAMRGKISPIADNDDLAKVLTKYYKTGAVSVPKTAKAKKSKVPAVAVSTPAPEVAAPAVSAAA